MNKIEAELQAATKVKTKKNRQAYLMDLINAVGDLSEQDWDKLSLPAQEWYNEASKFADKKAELKHDPAEAKQVLIPDFEDENGAAEPADADEENAADADEETEVETDEDTTENATKKGQAAMKKKPARSKPAKVAKAKKAAKPATKKAVNGRGTGKLVAILEATWKHPSKKGPEIVELLQKQGISAGPSTITTVRSDFLRSVRFLAGKGLLKENPFAKEE